ncbi:hypothetical protein F5Y05DRAFT_416712 [Hypoxylon sp. FL0543]|nr:hypothetical protein F5Y05DRAFT_416712 [Hypoxylon sp. FL0543]
MANTSPSRLNSSQSYSLPSNPPLPDPASLEGINQQLDTTSFGVPGPNPSISDPAFSDPVSSKPTKRKIDSLADNFIDQPDTKRSTTNRDLTDQPEAENAIYCARCRKIIDWKKLTEYHIPPPFEPPRRPISTTYDESEETSSETSEMASTVDLSSTGQSTAKQAKEKSAHERTTSSPQYRELLKSNGIRVISSSQYSSAPPYINALIDRVLQPAKFEEMANTSSEAREFLQQIDSHYLNYADLVLESTTPNCEDDFRDLTGSLCPWKLDNKWMTVPLQERKINQSFRPKLMKPFGVQGRNTIPIPVPNIVYGYKYDYCQPAEKLSQVPIFCNQTNTTLPYLIVEQKGYGGNIFHAVNQCMGGAALCVHIARPFFDDHTAIFAIAVNDSVAHVYVMCPSTITESTFGLEKEYLLPTIDEDGNGKPSKEDLVGRLPYDCSMRLIAALSLLDPDHFRKLWRIVANIHAWSATDRFQTIKSKIMSREKGFHRFESREA